MLFRLIGLDLVRDLNLDAYKVQLIEKGKKLQILQENFEKFKEEDDKFFYQKE